MSGTQDTSRPSAAADPDTGRNPDHESDPAPVQGMTPSSIHWEVTGASVRGAGHVRAGVPNQDAILWHTPDTPDDPLILALADGHGSARYSRSDKGAQFAVESAVATLLDFARQLPADSPAPEIKQLAADQLPRLIVRAWQDKVEQHLATMPLEDGERHALQSSTAAASSQGTAPEPDPQPEDDQPADGQPVTEAAHPLLRGHSARPRPESTVYGATLLGVLITRRYIWYCQLGDGDILLMDAQGTVSRLPLPSDPRLLGNQTTSLCGENAWEDMRTYFQTIADRPPKLIMLATDGYANSFASDEDFFAAGSDYLDAIRATSLEETGRQLHDWLENTSAMGSGDDISVGLVYCRPA